MKTHLDIPAAPASDLTGGLLPMTSALEQKREATPRPLWQRSLAGAIRSPRELAERLELPAELVANVSRSVSDFPLLVPESFLRRMRRGDPNDPLLRQVLPAIDEQEVVSGFEADPLGEASARKAPGLLHKYAGRALLVLTAACAVHCRYCFRRSYPYAQEPKRLSDWEPAFAAIEQDPSLHEILLSGGDPLMLTDERLAELIARLDSVTHLRRLRLHTRLPIVLPERVTSGLLALLNSTRLTVVVVVHANHPHELAGDCAHALRSIVRSGIVVLNQSVLLRGINDRADVLAELSERLIDLGVLPYYLHQLDRVTGTAHFEVSETVGRELIAELRRRLPGYAVPRYVREVAGAEFKVPLELLDSERPA